MSTYSARKMEPCSHINSKTHELCTLMLVHSILCRQGAPCSETFSLPLALHRTFLTLGSRYFHRLAPAHTKHSHLLKKVDKEDLLCTNTSPRETTMLHSEYESRLQKSPVKVTSPTSPQHSPFTSPTKKENYSDRCACVFGGWIPFAAACVYLMTFRVLYGFAAVYAWVWHFWSPFVADFTSLNYNTCAQIHPHSRFCTPATLAIHRKAGCGDRKRRYAANRLFLLLICLSLVIVLCSCMRGFPTLSHSSHHPLTLLAHWFALSSHSDSSGSSHSKHVPGGFGSGTSRDHASHGIFKQSNQQSKKQ